jgi:phage baseplate assembly protein W
MTSFYGQGMSFPVALDPTGAVQLSSGPANIQQSVRVILGTQYGERVMRPTFGCNLKSLVFAPGNPQTAALARQYVLDGLRQWEPRISVQSVSVTPVPASSHLLITIAYSIKPSLDRQAMIYPFYLEQP